ncbi:hypothetical protein T484DRAFT_1977930 [Baffinella frigidus]|nr:hypothetical protein T484DRAFT_1977930 [Cryptophyta sp. CCMP2293]
MDEQYRPSSPPEHAILTIQRVQARRELPPPHVPEPRGFLMIGGALSAFSAYPRPAARSFCCNAFDQGTSAAAASTFSCRTSALVAQEVESSGRSRDGSKTTSFFAGGPFKRAAAQRKVKASHKKTNKTTSRKPWQASSSPSVATSPFLPGLRQP